MSPSSPLQNQAACSKSFDDGQLSDADLASLAKRTFPVERFSYIPNDGISKSYGEYSRLRLGGFDIQAEEPSSLLPRLRLARIYWPRRALCLPASVPTKELQTLLTRPLTAAEQREAISKGEGKSYQDNHDFLFRQWRDQQKVGLWYDALRNAGYDVNNMDWESFEDPETGEALAGAQWHTFWETLNIDLHIIADGTPDAVHFGFSFGGGYGSHWTEAPKALYHPSQDDGSFEIPGLHFLDPTFGSVPWFMSGNTSYVSRGFEHEVAGSEDDDGTSEVTRMEFEPLDPPIFTELMLTQLWPIQDRTVWDLLTTRMDVWDAAFHSFGSTTKKSTERPRLRPLFEAPMGWTPAPDGSVAAAILRSIAYGKSRDRLDNRLIAETNNLVRCFRDMKDGLARDFGYALKRNGYDND